MLEVEEAPSTGYTLKWANAGDMKTDGMELDLVFNPVRTRDLNWVSRLSYYTTSSEITRLDVDPYKTSAPQSSPSRACPAPRDHHQHLSRSL